jgi:hypothetical protein
VAGKVSLYLDEDLLPDDVLLLLYVQRCVLHDAHLWPEEFPDLSRS